jgi:hypothetical protein
MSVRLYVGNLPKESVEREKLQALFADEGVRSPLKSSKIAKLANVAVLPSLPSLAMN